jgi:hypothetical protein
MSDLAIVESPALFPNKCISCPSIKGPMIDWRVEAGATGMRVYQCKSCVKRAALAFGFAEGPELDRLMEVGTVIEEKDRNIATMQAVANTDHENILRLQSLVEKLTEERNEARDTIHLHERRAREMREAIEAAAGERPDKQPLLSVPSGEDDWKDGA